MGTYDTYHGGPISPNMDDPHIFPLEEEVLGILEDAGVPSDVYDRVVKAARKTLVEYETRIESLSAQVAELKKAVVPREPTEQMIDAAQAADLEGQDDPLECWRQVWLVMYDAAKEGK